jgi:Fe2+ transport system protein FeoA
MNWSVFSLTPVPRKSKLKKNEIQSQVISKEIETVSQEILPLDLLGSGEWADVEEVCGEPKLVGRMAELGLRAGSRLRVLQAGRPCLLQVGESRLSLRGDAGFQVLVRPVAGNAAAVAGK